MMNKKKLPHIITVVSFVVFIVLCLACNSTPASNSSTQPRLSSASAYYDRGRTHYHNKNYILAIEDFTEAIRLDPNYHLAYYGRALVYADHRYFDSVITNANQALRLSPNNASYLLIRAWAYLGKEDYAMAIADYEAALQIDPKIPGASEGLDLARVKLAELELEPEPEPEPLPPPLFTGDGGRDIRLAVLEPTGEGLSADEQWMLTLVQGSITRDFSAYSAITIIDRQAVERTLENQAQASSGSRSDEDIANIGRLINANHVLTGSVNRTDEGLMLELVVIDTATGEKVYTYPPTLVTQEEIENLSAVREASADLLEQMGVNLTARGQAELNRPDTQAQAEIARARAVAEERRRAEEARLAEEARIAELARIAGEFDVSGLRQDWNGRPKTVTITPKAGRTSGPITVYYNGSTTPPVHTGNFTITFDAGPAGSFAGARGIPAGTLVVYIDHITNMQTLGRYLASHGATTPENPINLTIVVNDLTGLNDTIRNSLKHVNLDLSQSTALTSIGNNAFGGSYQYNTSRRNTMLVGIVLPNSITSIGNEAFRECTNLTSVTLGNGVTNIGTSAFAYTNLASITIPDSVTTIGNNAFYGCTRLGNVTIGTGVTSIGQEAFYGCTSLGNVTIGAGVTSIGTGAFKGCTSLRNVTIPNRVTEIKAETFNGCTSLVSITLGTGVTTFNYNAFWGCTSLTAINAPSANTRYSSVNGIVYNKDQTVIELVPQGRSGSVIIPRSVTDIGQYAFYGCAKLTSITIPNTVTIIRQYAFQACTGLTGIEIPDSVETIERNAFYGTGLTSITIPSSVHRIGQEAFYNCNNLNHVTFGGGIAAAEFSTSSPFRGDLRTKYLANGPGTYTVTVEWYQNYVWTKQLAGR